MRKFIGLLVGIVLFSAQAYSQNRTFTGKVTDAKDGTPMSGVSVMGQNEKTGSKTDANGNFRIILPGSTRALIFTYVGYTLQTVPLGSSVVVNVQLQNEANNLSEVVVTTFGIKRDKKLLGYSTPTISADAA